METKFKVLKEYERFYLAESPSGWKETFNKYEYKPNKDGYITKRREHNFKGNPIPHDPGETPWKKLQSIKNYGGVYSNEKND